MHLNINVNKNYISKQIQKTEQTVIHCGCLRLIVSNLLSVSLHSKNQ